ncbi:4Fe-4S dicluster domain-containing protein [Kordiimonas sp.]|uniref:4Fe-4S dicluster domain-containing protein n=1 Tax=Kordiimonas sp. TaxID=1970157 RepID=UPI003A9442BA
MQDDALDRRHFLRGRWRESSQKADTHSRQIEIADNCLARTGITCMACRDHCAEDAIKFRLRPGGVSIPELSNTLCTHCGDCVPVCPVAAIIIPPTQKETFNA